MEHLECANCGHDKKRHDVAGACWVWINRDLHQLCQCEGMEWGEYREE